MLLHHSIDTYMKACILRQHEETAHWSAFQPADWVIAAAGLAA
jgi:hypothetical protein